MKDGGRSKRLTDALGDKRVVPNLPPEQVPITPETEPEHAPPQDPPGACSSWSAFITYTDSQGEESARRITLRSIKGHYGKPTTIGAFCHERRAHRSFKIDGISAMFDTDTGEVLDPLEHCIALHRNGALQIEDLVLTRVMRVMAFTAKCDGVFHPSERDALEQVVGRYFWHFGGDDAAAECAMRQAPRLAPSAEDMHKDLNWLKRDARGPAICRFILDGVRDIIDADGRIALEEMLWAAELQATLKSIADRSPRA